LAAALRPFRERFQPVLFSDTVRFHFADIVLNACSNNGIWPMFVPAKTTWLLQALDTHAFKAFKSFLANAYQQARIDAGRSDLTIGQFLPCLYQAIESVLQGRCWSNAFEKNGFGIGQVAVSERILRELGVATPLQVSSARPTRDELQCVFPARTVIPESLLWRQFQIAPVAKVSAKAVAEVVESKSKALVGQVPLLGRTRSEHKRAVAVQAAAASSGVASAEAVAVVPEVARASRLVWFRKDKAKGVAVAEIE